MDHLVIIGLVIIAILIILWYHRNNKFGISNTQSIMIRTERYNVHNEHHNPEEAANLMDEITKRNDMLIDHLKEKYTENSLGSIDPTKNNSIDRIHGTEMYSETSMDDLDNVRTHEYIQMRVEQLMRNYNSEKIYEISPLNPQGNTSYAEGKKLLVLCLREKKPTSEGLYHLHDVNTMMFVVIHELAHMMNDLWGHSQDSNFWSLFKFLLVNAVEIGVYKPENYSLKPIVYCGLKLTYNPLYDNGLVLN